MNIGGLWGGGSVIDTTGPRPKGGLDKKKRKELSFNVFVSVSPSHRITGAKVREIVYHMFISHTLHHGRSP